METQGYKINYISQLCDNDKKFTIDYDELKANKKMISQQGFYEILDDDTPFVHPYFDFDSIKNIDDYNIVIGWLNKAKNEWGSYVIGGYTKDENIAKETGLAHVPEGNHIISIHVIFYEVKIKFSVLADMMKHNKNGLWDYRGICNFCDPNVYKVKRQAMRHTWSNKIYNPSKIEKTHGKFTDKVKFHMTLITPMGDEKEVNILSFLAKKEIEVKKYNNEMIDEITYDNDELIKLSKEEIIDLLDNFDNCFNTMIVIAGILGHSPYDKKFVMDVICSWYKKAEHDKPEQAENIVNQYYEGPENTNRWLFTLLSKIPKDIRGKYLKAYNQFIDVSYDINNGTLTWMNVSRKRYDDVISLLNDMRQIFGFANGKYYLKVKKNGLPYIQIYNETAIRNMFITYPIKGDNKHNMYQIIRQNINVFNYEDAKFYYNTENKNVINLFCGFKYEAVKHDYSILTPFLNHIREVICDGDDEKYDYLMKWMANILKHVCVKNGTMPIIYGGQGSGKTITAQIFAELLGNYALPNVINIDNVFGRFNSLIRDTLLIVINETSEAGEKFAYADKIKSLLTESKIVIEQKGVDAYEVDNFANCIMTTNNSYPVRDEKGQRRFIYFRTNDKYKGNYEYYDKLMAPIQNKITKEFDKAYMETLYHYMLNEIDITNFNPEKYINELNNDIMADQNENLERQYYDLDLVDRFVVDNITKFIDGYPSYYITNDIIPGYKANGIFKKIRQYCDCSRKEEGHNKISIYTFNKDKANDLWNIAYYKNREDIEEYYKNKEINELSSDEDLVNVVDDILKEFNINDYRKASRRSCLDTRKVKSLFENSNQYDLFIDRLITDGLITKKYNDYKINEEL